MLVIKTHPVVCGVVLWLGKHGFVLWSTYVVPYSLQISYIMSKYTTLGIVLKGRCAVCAKLWLLIHTLSYTPYRPAFDHRSVLYKYT